VRETFFVEKKEDKIKFIDFGGYENRNPSTMKIIMNVLPKINKDLSFFVNTGDKSIDRDKTFSYSTTSEDYSKTCPDFIYDCWKEVGINDYEEKKLSIHEAGNSFYRTNKIGWIGSFTSQKRRQVYDLFNHKSFLDIRVTNLSKQNGVCVANNFLTLEEQIKEWKYLLDIEGNGYSGRVKLLIGSQRPVFLIDRQYKEFYYQFMEPWKHYIPVKNDLSDFEENYNIIERDIKLYQRIVLESNKFSQKFLTKKFAEEYYMKILSELK
jgi:hypothetical protein